MGKEIEQVITSMEFDNSNFEKNTKQTLKSISALKESLQFDKAAESLSNLEEVSKSVSMETLGENVNAVQEKFSALEIVAITALVNISNSAVNAGKQLARSITIQPLQEGWAKYESKTASVQTIMSATGKTIDEVTASLDKLSWFTDETSYSFTDMVNNIGKFTSVGVDLDEAVTAMQGISNWAALSGAGISEASRAMYNLSQAMGAGSVKAIDWKSIENAGMATEEFKNNAIEAAKSLNVLNKEGKSAKGTMIDAKNFTSTLAEGWFTKDVLMETLKQYGKYADAVYEVADSYDSCSEAMRHVSDQGMELGKKAFQAAQETKTFTDGVNYIKESIASGWLDSYEIIFGNYEEAKSLWSGLVEIWGELFAYGKYDRNELLQSWKEFSDPDIDLTGRELFVESLFNAFNALLEIVNTVKAGFKEIFPDITAEQLYNLTKKLHDFTSSLIMSEEMAEKMQKVIRGIASVFHILWNVLKGVWSIIASIAASFKILFDDLLDILGLISDLIGVVDNGLQSSYLIQQVLTIIGNTVQYVAKIFHTLFGLVKSFLKLPIVSDLIGAFKELFNVINQKLVSPFFSTINGVLDGTSKRVQKVRGAFDSFGGVFASFGKALHDALSNFAILDLAKSAIEIITMLLERLVDIVSKLIRSLVQSVNDLSFEKMIQGISAGISLFMMTTITQLGQSIKSITDILSDLSDSLGEAISSEVLINRSEAIMKFAAAVGILALSMYVISGIDYDKMLAGVAAIASLGAVLVSMVNSFQLTGNRTLAGILKETAEFRSIGKFLVKLAASLLIMAVALRVIGTMDSKQVLLGISAILLLAEIMVSVANVITKNSKKMTASISGIIAFSVGILILATACKKLASLSFTELIKGIAGLAAIIAIMVESALILDDISKGSGQLIKISVALIIMSLGMMLMSKAIKMLGSLDTDQLRKGLIVIALTLIGIYTYLDMMNGVEVMSSAAAMLTMSAAMILLATAFRILGSQNLTQVGSGLLSLLGGLGILIAALFALSKMPNLAKAIAAFSAISAALILFSLSMRILGRMSFEQVAVALASLAGGMMIMAYTLNAMEGTAAGAAALLIASSAMVLFAGALTIMSMIPWSALLIGVGIMSAFMLVLVGIARIAEPAIKPMLAIAAAVALTGAAMILFGVGLGALGIGLTAFVESLAALGTSLGIFLEALITSIVNTAEALVGLFPYVFKIIKEIVLAIIDTLVEAVPKILKIVSSLVSGILQTLIDNLPNIMRAISIFLSELINLLMEFIPKVIDTLFFLINTFLDKLTQNLPSIINRVFALLETLITTLLDRIMEFLPKAVVALFNFVTAAIHGLADMIRDNPSVIREAIGDVLSTIVDILIDTIKYLITLGPIRDLIGWIGGLFESAGEEAGEGFAEGMENSSGAIENAAHDMAETASDTVKDDLEIHSPSRIFMGYGEFVGEGFAIGIKSASVAVKDATEELGDSAMDPMQKAIGEISDILSQDLDSQPVIRPVLDMSDVKTGFATFDSMANARQGIMFGGSLQYADATVSTISKGQGFQDDESRKDIHTIAELVKQIADDSGKDIVNQFNIQDENPEVIADRVSRIIQEQLERRKSVWA